VVGSAAAVARHGRREDGRSAKGAVRTHAGRCEIESHRSAKAIYLPLRFEPITGPVGSSPSPNSVCSKRTPSLLSRRTWKRAGESARATVSSTGRGRPQTIWTMICPDSAVVTIPRDPRGSPGDTVPFVDDDGESTSRQSVGCRQTGQPSADDHGFGARWLKGFVRSCGLVSFQPALPVATATPIPARMSPRIP